MIELRGVTLTYPNGTRALDDIDLEIGKADFVFLVGHSGTGKSSLLKLLYREAIPDSGEVIVDGIRVDKLRRGKVAALRRNIGVVFQDFKLLTAQDGLGERRLRPASDRRAFERRDAAGAARARPRRSLAQEPHVAERALGRRTAARRDRARAGQQSRRSCSATSRPATSIRRTRPRSSSSCSASTSRARPCWSQPTIKRSSTGCGGALSGSKTGASCTTTSEAITFVDWGRVQFFLGEVFANFTRNAAMQFTAIGTVAVTIVMLGTFLYVRETLATFGQGILKQIEIAVYLDDNVDRRASEVARHDARRRRTHHLGALRAARRGSARDARALGQRLRHLAAHRQPAAERVPRRGAQRRRRARRRRDDRETAGRRQGRLRRRHRDEAAARRRRDRTRRPGHDRAAWC